MRRWLDGSWGAWDMGGRWRKWALCLSCRSDELPKKAPARREGVVRPQRLTFGDRDAHHDAQQHSTHPKEGGAPKRTKGASAWELAATSPPARNWGRLPRVTALGRATRERSKPACHHRDVTELRSTHPKLSILRVASTCVASGTARHAENEPPSGWQHMRLCYRGLTPIALCRRPQN